MTKFYIVSLGTRCEYDWEYGEIWIEDPIRNYIYPGETYEDVKKRYIENRMDDMTEDPEYRNVVLHEYDYISFEKYIPKTQNVIEVNTLEDLLEYIGKDDMCNIDFNKQMGRWEFSIL